MAKNRNFWRACDCGFATIGFFGYDTGLIFSDSNVDKNADYGKETVMPQELHGKLQVGKEKYGIVVGRFNDFITSKLLEGALDCLKRHGAGDDQITIMWVPGSFEVPMAAQNLAQSGKFGWLNAFATGNLVHVVSQKV